MIIDSVCGFSLLYNLQFHKIVKFSLNGLERKTGFKQNLSLIESLLRLVEKKAQNPCLAVDPKNLTKISSTSALFFMDCL